MNHRCPQGDAGSIYVLNKNNIAMKKLMSLTLMLMVATVLFAQETTYKPYIIGTEISNKSLNEVKMNVKEFMPDNGLRFLGEYQPADDSQRWVIAFTSDELIKAASSVGGAGGFALVLKIGITKEGDKIVVSYNNPAYWGMAYLRDDFDNVKFHYEALDKKLEKLMSAVGTFKGIPYGSEKGLEEEDLKEYQYMFGMPDFEDWEVLGEYGSYEEAVAAVDKNLENGVPNVKAVYTMEVKGEQMKLYGMALSGPDGEANFLPKIDFAVPRHTPFLPYEMLIMGKKVVMLHGRFRIALGFPDLTMGTFTKIMSTPGDIEDMLENVVSP